MSNLVAEILLRCIKPALALLLATVLYVVLTVAAGADGSAVLALLCWLSAAAFLLLIGESPI